MPRVLAGRPVFVRERRVRRANERIVALLSVNTRREGGSAMCLSEPTCVLARFIGCLTRFSVSDRMRDWKIRNTVLVSCIFPRSLQHCPVAITQFKPNTLYKYRNGCLQSGLAISFIAVKRVWTFQYGRFSFTLEKAEILFCFIFNVRIRMNISACWFFPDILWRSLPLNWLLEFSCLI